MKTFRWKVKPDMEVNSQPSVREVRFGDGYSQRMAAGLNADLENIPCDAFRDPGGGPTSGGIPGRARWLEGVSVDTALCLAADKGDLCRLVITGSHAAG